MMSLRFTSYNWADPLKPEDLYVWPLSPTTFYELQSQDPTCQELGIEGPEKPGSNCELTHVTIIFTTER